MGWTKNIYDQMCESMGNFQELYIHYYQYGDQHAFAAEARKYTYEFEQNYLNDIEEAMLQPPKSM